MLKTFSSNDRPCRRHRLAVTETDDETEPPARKTARAANKARLSPQPANHRAAAVAGRRQGT